MTTKYILKPRLWLTIDRGEKWDFSVRDQSGAKVEHNTKLYLKPGESIRVDCAGTACGILTLRIFDENDQGQAVQPGRSYEHGEPAPDEQKNKGLLVTWPAETIKMTQGASAREWVELTREPSERVDDDKHAFRFGNRFHADQFNIAPGRGYSVDPSTRGPYRGYRLYEWDPEVRDSSGTGG